MPSLDRQALDALAISDRARFYLAELIEALAAELKGDLHSAMLYGSAARGEWIDGVSDLNLLITLCAVDRAALDRVGAPLRRAGRRSRVRLRVVTEGELRRGADAFAVLVFDIQGAHVMLAGPDPVAGLRVERDDLRRAVEYELRREVMAVRGAYLDALPQRAALQREILSSVYFRAVASLRALLHLMGQPVPARTAEALAALEALLRRDATVLREIAELKSNRRAVSQERLTGLSMDLTALLAEAIRRVDRL